MTIAGVIQLEVTDFFRDVLDEYSDVRKYPFGPPSHVTREIIDNPDTPARNSIESCLFFRRKTGVLLLIVGSVLQIASVWQ